MHQLTVPEAAREVGADLPGVLARGDLHQVTGTGSGERVPGTVVTVMPGSGPVEPPVLRPPLLAVLGLALLAMPDSVCWSQREGWGSMLSLTMRAGA